MEKTILQEKAKPKPKLSIVISYEPEYKFYFLYGRKMIALDADELWAGIKNIIGEDDSDMLPIVNTIIRMNLIMLERFYDEYLDGRSHTIPSVLHGFTANSVPSKAVKITLGPQKKIYLINRNKALLIKLPKHYFLVGQLILPFWVEDKSSYELLKIFMVFLDRLGLTLMK